MSKMKRAVLYKPEDLRIEEAEIPKPGPGEVVVKNAILLAVQMSKVTREVIH